MSEGEKMGLFGSKDENNESNSEEKKDLEKAKENPADFAPYNIDSDSETYDTEALSIMDINDIIGVQADTPGDSTLESEFAALSQIITDSKDEFGSHIDNPSTTVDSIIKSDREIKRRIDTAEFSTKEEDRKNAEAEVEKSVSSTDVTNISKSLQLIGEAYISEDSQGTDIEDTEERSISKSKELEEPAGACSNSEENKISPTEDVDAGIATRNVAEESCNRDDPATEISKLETPEESLEASTSIETTKSADLTDSGVADERTNLKEQTIESMDVDVPAVKDVVEKASFESQSSEKLEAGMLELTKTPVEAQRKSSIDQEINVDNETGETGEPMEIDEPNPGLTDTVESQALDKIRENCAEPTDDAIVSKLSPVNETDDVQPELREESTVDDENEAIENSPKAQIICASEGASLEAEQKTSEEESLDIPNSAKSELELSESSEKETTSLEPNLNMETDESLLDKPKVDERESKNSEALVKESIVESGDEKPMTSDHGTKETLEKVDARITESPEDSEKINETTRTTIEPMEIDNPPQEETNEDEVVKISHETSETSAPIIESLPDNTLKHATNGSDIEETLESTTKASDIPATVDNDSIPESSEKSIAVASEPCEKPLETCGEIPSESFAEINLKDSSDEQMEVDGKSKAKVDQEESELSQAVESLRQIEETTTTEDKSKETFASESSTDTVDDAATPAPEVSQICDTSILRESPNKDSEVQESKDGDKDFVEPDAEDERISTKATTFESPIENPEREDIGTPDKENVLTEDKVESQVVTQIPESSAVGSCQRGEIESTDIDVQQCIDDKKDLIKEDAEEKDSLSSEKTKLSNDEKEEIKNAISIEEIIADRIEDEKNEEDKESIDKIKESVVSSEETECLKEEIEDRKLTKETAEDSVRIEETTEESVSIPEKEDNVVTAEESKTPNEDTKKSSIFVEKVDSFIEDEMETSVVPEAVSVAPKTESSMLQDTEDKMISEKCESPKENDISLSISSSQELPSNQEEKDILPETIGSSNLEEEEDSNSSIKEETLNKDIPERLNSPKETSSMPMPETENLKSEKAESSNNEVTECLTSPEMTKEILVDAEMIESVNIKEHEESNPDQKDEKLCEDKEESTIPLEKPESLNEKEKETKETKLETAEEVSQNNKEESLVDSDEKASGLIQDSMDYQSNIEGTIDQEEQVSSIIKMANRSGLQSSPTNAFELEMEEDEMEEEMNLRVESEYPETPENNVDDNSRTRGSTPEEMYVEPEAIVRSNMGETNLSVDPEEKNVTSNLSQSSTYKPEDNYQETPEKSAEEADENLKNILSTASGCVTQMFNDDEQSQSTQEMMESILETDKGNINKILDDQEVRDLESSGLNGMEKLPKESDDMLNKALEDPMAGQNIDSLEGLLDLDLMPENEESNHKAVEPIVDKVMQDSCNDDIEAIGKAVDVSLLIGENNTVENRSRSASYDPQIGKKIMDNDDEEIVPSVNDLMNQSNIVVNRELEETSNLMEKDLEAFDLATVVADPLVNVDPSEEAKIDLPEDLLREIAVDEERKIELTEKLLLEDNIPQQDILLSASIPQPTKIELADEVFLPVETEREMELAEDISLDSAVRDQVLNEVAAEIENLPPNSEISELESAVKFLQESEEQDLDSPLVLSPKIMEDVVDDMAQNSDVGIFSTDADICEDPSELVAELESIIPDPIAISEAEIINEAAKLEIERKIKLSEEKKLSSPVSSKIELNEEMFGLESPLTETSLEASKITEQTETSKIPREAQETITVNPEVERIVQEPLKKSAPIPKISILEERLKIPPKIEIPVGEVTQMCELPTTPKTSLLIQRDVKTMNLMKQLESPKSMEKSELKIVDTPRKDSERNDFENVGSPRIILKIAKSAIADCSEPRSPKSPKIRSATNSPNPEDSPGQKLGKIKLKLSKGGHPSIISNDNIEEHCGQWHTEGSSSLSPLGMKIKFSKIPDTANLLQTDKHETEDVKEQAPKHKFEEAKRTDSPLGMKIKLSKTGDPSIVQQDGKDSSAKHKDKLDIMQQGSPKRTESPIGVKIKLSKSGDASIIQPDRQESAEEHNDRGDTTRRTESPLGMKFKLFKTGDASIVQTEILEDNQQETKRTDSPVSKKSKLSKTRGSAAIMTAENTEDNKEKLEIPEVPRRTESPLGMKIKLSKSGDASIITNQETRESTKQKPEVQETSTIAEGLSTVKIKVGKSSSTIQQEVPSESESVAGITKRSDPTIGMKIKLSKSGDASIIHPEREEGCEDTRLKEKSENVQDNARKPDSSIGMKIKLSKSGDASIIQSSKKSDDQSTPMETRESENSPKMKSQKNSDGSILDTEKKEKSLRRKETEVPLEMKIKLSKTGHPTIVACNENALETSSQSGTSKESSTGDESTGTKMLKSMHGANLHGNRSELTIEPVQSKKAEVGDESVTKRKDITISPIESKKAKLEAKFSQILPEVTIQPIVPRDQKQQIMLETKSGSISRQQINVISQEISITQVRSNKPMDLSMTDKLKSMLTKNAAASSTDCEIIEHRPELIIVNENSNSSQDVMIIEEVPVVRGPENKIPKKRGRPRRNPLPVILAKPGTQNSAPVESNVQRDPLALDDVTQMVSHIAPQIYPPKENETQGRPKRTCRSQKSYAPPRRGRGRGGRGKRKMDVNVELLKRPRIDQDLDMIERSTTALMSMLEPPTSGSSNITSDLSSNSPHNNSELYKALRQPTMDRKMPNAIARNEVEQAVNDSRNDPNPTTKDHFESLIDARIMSHLDGVMNTSIKQNTCQESFENKKKIMLVDVPKTENQASGNVEKSEMSVITDKIMDKIIEEAKDNKDSSSAMDHENWLTPSSRKQPDGRNDANLSNVQVMDEETRMSAESGSRSQTPAKNMSVQASETIVNEESQGSVLSTATTESEKVKVKNRRMEINFDPDEGPFTVDKVAEYDWPLDPTKKNETFMIQEQISHYLGVKSFKRKYPDLKRRMVDMEERNYLREHLLVSEAMCDMGLTAVLSSEVLDVMCSDFPDQYEEYRKYIREKQMKEHLKKQKELTAAANAEKNRIDLAEMAVQSALSWNVGLNKARRESRKCSLDLQTFTIHVPKKQQKVEKESGGNHYPVALIPGQYTDYYREYTPAELRYYPLNTVLYGPMRPNERKFDSQSEGSQSDSDSDSSSDDSSSSSSEGTQDTEASQSTMDDVDVELTRQKEDIKTIKCKMCLKHLNKCNRTEVLIQCGTCNGYVHPSCIDLTLDMVPHIQAYAWQCTDCKTCAQCHDPADEDKMLFCDMCDRGYHIYCVGLRRVPQGRWHCQECAVCASCGSREAGGANSDRNSVAQWQHEYKKGDKNTRVYVSTLCVPCSKLWRKGRYCPHCSRCHTVPRLDLEVNLVHCSACDKYLHLGCVETKDLTIDRKNYRCDFCQPLRHHMVKTLVSKVFRT